VRTNSSRRSSKHSSNQVGAPSLPQDRRTKKNQGKSFYSIYRSKIKTLQFVLDHLESSDNIPDAKNRILLLNDPLSFFHSRSSLPSSRWKRLPIVLQELTRYHRYAKSLKHVVKDLLHKV